jgi:tetratricopeptide (TPR) repeat protein
VSLSDAERQLESLLDAHLLQQPAVGRYQFHDLLSLHAHTTAMTEESESTRCEVLRRMVDFYLHTAYAASRLLDQQHPPIDIGAPSVGIVPYPLADNAAAMVWFDQNHSCVVAARTSAEERGWDTSVWQLAWTLDNFHYRRGRIQDNLAAWHAGLAAGERLGDLAVQARAHRRLGLAYPRAGKPVEALNHLNKSLALSEQVGDTLGQAGAHFVLALAWAEQREDLKALTHVTNALSLYRELGNAKWEVRALSMTGACHTRLGHHKKARAYCESALSMCRQLGDLYGQADSLDSLGTIACHTDKYVEAVKHYQDALSLWHELDNTYRQADTLAAIGEAYAKVGQNNQSLQAWREALDLYRKQRRTADVECVERKLATLDM